MTTKKALPSTFGPTFNGDFPSEMRRQLWPLCCGASILSGFKAVNGMSDAELDESIKNACEVARPDFQVFNGEQMKPKFTFLTLNSGQMSSARIMAAIERAGFFEIGRGRPRGGDQGFFLRDTSGTWNPTGNKKAPAKERAETAEKATA
jgi:hypothetical protein